MFRYFPIVFIIVFLYSGLMKWINIGIDLTLLSLIFLIASLIFHRKKESILKSYSLVKTEVNAIVFFGILYSLTSVYTLSESYYLEKIAYLWIAIFSFLLPIIFLNKKSKLTFFFKSFNFFSIATLVVLAYLFMTSKWYIFITNQEDYENTPNYLAVASLLGVFIICNMRKKKIKAKILSVIAIGFMFLLSGRGPIIGLGLVYVIYLLLDSKKTKNVLYISALITIVYFGWKTYSSSEEIINAGSRFGTLFEDNPRYAQIKKAFTIISNNSLLGVGIGGYGLAADNVDEFWHPHNLILEVFSEAGFFITSIFLYLLFKIFIVNNLKISYKKETVIFILASAYLFIQAMKSGGIPDMRVTFFWLGFMTFAMKRYEKEELNILK